MIPAGGRLSRCSSSVPLYRVERARARQGGNIEVITTRDVSHPLPFPPPLGAPASCPPVSFLPWERRHLACLFFFFFSLGVRASCPLFFVAFPPTKNHPLLGGVALSLSKGRGGFLACHSVETHPAALRHKEETCPSTAQERRDTFPLSLPRRVMQIILLGGPLLPCAVPVCDRVPGVRASSPQAAKMAALPGRGRASGPRRGLPDRSLGGSCHNMHHPSQEGIKKLPSSSPQISWPIGWAKKLTRSVDLCFTLFYIYRIK